MLTFITGALNKCKYGKFYQYIGKLSGRNRFRTLAKYAFAKNTGRQNLDLLTNYDFSQEADVDITISKVCFSAVHNISMQAIYMP